MGEFNGPKIGRAGGGVKKPASGNRHRTNRQIDKLTDRQIEKHLITVPRDLSRSICRSANLSICK